MPPPIKSIDEAVLRAEWAKGTRISDIAAMVGVKSDATISSRAKSLGLPPRFAGRYQPNPERDAQVRELHAEGLHNAEIARRVKVDGDTLSKTLKRLGLERNATPKRERAETASFNGSYKAASFNGRSRATETERALALGRHIVQRCAHCSWTTKGAMGDTRKAFNKHECTNIEAQQARRDAAHEARANRPAPAMQRAA